MTEKQRRFVEEYLIDLNATQAAIRAGFSAKSAYSAGGRMLKNVEVAKAIKEAQAKRSKRTQISADQVVRELAKIGFSNLRDFIEWGPAGVKLKDCASLSEEQVAIVSEISEDKDGLKLKLHDKVKALDLIGKYLGMFQGNGTGRPDKHKKILNKFRIGELTLKEAAIEFEINNLPIPETIRIMLAKEQPEPEDPSKGQYMIISDEEMEKRVAERKAAIEQQLLGLPERQQEMRELHKQVADKFGPGSVKDV